MRKEENQKWNKSQHNGHTNKADQLQFHDTREVERATWNCPSYRDLRLADIEPALPQDLTPADQLRRCQQGARAGAGASCNRSDGHLMVIFVRSSTEVGETPGRGIRAELIRAAAKQLCEHLGELDKVLQQILRQRLLVFPHDQHGADTPAPLGRCVSGRRIDVQRGCGDIVEMGVTRELERGFGRQSSDEQRDSQKD